MTEQEWLASDRPERMLVWLNTQAVFTERKRNLAMDALQPAIMAAPLANWIGLSAATAAQSASVLRDICGNPWRPVPGSCDVWTDGSIYLCRTHQRRPVQVTLEATMCPAGLGYLKGVICRWNDGTVPKIAQAIYDERRFDWMPELADALEESGVDNAEMIAHCRGPEPHVRGCFVLDLLLGKE